MMGKHDASSLAWVMIILGVIFYLRDMQYLNWTFLSSEWAVVLIVFGVLHLYWNKK